MALLQALRALAPLVSGKSQTAAVGAWHLAQMSTGATSSKNQVVHLLDAREDPDVDAAIRSYQLAAYKASKSAPEAPEAVPELTAKVQRKYVAAQIVDSGLQNIAVPLSATTAAPVKRYVQQLLTLSSKAGFEDPLSEVTKRVSERAAGVDTVKELLVQIKPLTSPDFHTALVDALAQVEAKINSTVTLDGASAGYKAFAEQVKVVAAQHKLPVALLLEAKKPKSTVGAEYAAWLQSARVTDSSTELDALRSEATALLDRHLAKGAPQIRKDQAASMATLHKKIEAAQGAPWAKAFASDLAAIAAYDAAVAADPVNGPKVAVA
eukprot:CAMPEP_0119105660 /NCGR_PEP_ID=MMETSP1180-20130426/3565_1 /TAXON_ID=3052 ORGANISM="Chlamydomonas cf sp, Strain CCMP681" /NCGR_SAMPLE_ID=MMETSP1180 /ASSEMBLY_ACC=CAM_ASM_000741 /LENGTH=322 /DNA_ID=CAMNT_0007090781 /DNA_START=27 /DNA_END=995 /DNA_ORIENTATION=+